jgi:lipopolysaccharide/colanic/teichoic acid biosynthesis glycosyltransferase
LEDIPLPHPEKQRISSPPLLAGMPNHLTATVIPTFREMVPDHAVRRNWPAIKLEILVAPRFAWPHAPVAAPLPRRLFDAACAAAGLAILAPLFAVIAVAIKLDDGGSIFYSHARIGKWFRDFRLFKFRSMICRPTDGSTVTAPQDVRITRVGRFLRRYKLDELPQLINVLKGEMQLVGARPQMRKFVDIFHGEYEELLQSAPGITDPASLFFRNEELFFHEGSIEEQYVTRIMPMKLQISIKYSRTRTFFSDLEILFRTVRALPSPTSVLENEKFNPASRSFPDFSSRKSSQAVERPTD